MSLVSFRDHLFGNPTFQRISSCHLHNLVRNFVLTYSHIKSKPILSTMSTDQDDDAGVRENFQSGEGAESESEERQSDVEAAAERRWVDKDMGSDGESTTTDEDEQEEERQLATVPAFKARLKALHNQLDSPILEGDTQSQRQFLKEFESCLCPQNRAIKTGLNIEEYNILYWMAQSSTVVQANAWLVKYLVEKHSELLEEPDEHNQGPLFNSFSRSNF